MKNTILIVDDEPGIRLLLEEIFKNEGYQVDSADTGLKAWEKLQSKRFNLLLIDYKLPVMDGMDVIKKLVANDMQLPVILMTGMVESISKEEKDIACINHLLAKPFDIQDVIEKVCATLQ